MVTAENNPSELPICEVCAEELVSVQTQDVGLCDDCAAEAIREAMAPLFGKICASVSRGANGHLVTCLAPYGVEHDHG